MDKNGKINILCIPSDRFGVGFWRSVSPHRALALKMPEKFNVDIMYEIPQQGILEEFYKQYDIVHIHKKLDDNCEIIHFFQKLGCMVIIDVDDAPKLDKEHPMFLTSEKEKWYIPINKSMMEANAVTTTTVVFQKEIIQKFNKNAFVLPNALPENEGQFILHKEPSDRIRFGIVCGSSHYYDLIILKDMIQMLPKEYLDKIQFVLCGFDIKGTKTVYHPGVEEPERIPIKTEESIWNEFERILTNNYQTISKEHKEFLQKYIQTEDPFKNEPYMRYWTIPIHNYYQQYNHVDCLLAPLHENHFNSVKCIVGNSLISTNNGIKYIKDIVENKLQISTEVKNKKNKIINHFKYENVKTKKIITKNGFEIEGTPHHRILIDNVWTELQSLKINDKIDLTPPHFLQKEYQIINYPISLLKDDVEKIIINENIGKLIGYFIGRCGYINDNNSSYESTYSKILENSLTLFQNLSKNICETEINDFKKVFPIICKNISNNTTCAIPNEILNSPQTVITEFLRGLFESDGTVGDDLSISLMSKNKNLINQVQYILLGYGIVGGITKTYDKNCYILNINQNGCKIFYDKIGFISDSKQKALNNITELQISNNLETTFLTDTIISIEDNFNDVYDIEVNEVHEYNANGIINHNSELKFVEAGFAKIPIIAQDFGPYAPSTIGCTPILGKNGIVNKDGNCFLIDSTKNRKSWLKTIKWMVDNPDSFQWGGQNLYNFVKDRYSLDAVMKKRANIYIDMVTNKEKYIK